MKIPELSLLAESLDEFSHLAEVGMFLDTTTAARLQIEGMPGDFWEELDEVDYGENLKVSKLGMPGRKYLEIFHAVNSGGAFDRASFVGLHFTEAELLNIARWLREEALFDHRRGDLLMEILTQLQ